MQAAINNAGRMAGLSRLSLAARSAVAAILNPQRADAVAALGETTGTPALRQLHARMSTNEVGRRILAERPRITEDSLDLAHLRTLSPDTFGRAYANYLDEHEFSPVSQGSQRQCEALILRDAALGRTSDPKSST